MSNYTPGPWQADKMACYVWGKDENGGPFTVAEIRGWAHLSNHRTDDEAIAIQTANARLIAAAPEMAELLEEAIQAIWEKGKYIFTSEKIELTDHIKGLLRRIDGEDA